MAQERERPMKGWNLAGITAVILLLAACAAGASAYTLKLDNLYLASATDTGSIPVWLDRAPDGIAGYSITFHLSNPGAVEITGVDIPAWADPSFTMVSPGTNDVTLVVADVKDGIVPTQTPPGGGFHLGTVQLAGVTKSSSSEITVIVNQMDADNGAVVIPAVTEGIIDVELDPGSLSVTTTQSTGAALAGAQVSLDGVPVPNAATPVLIPGVPVGDHRVKVSLAGWMPLLEEQVVPVKTGEQANINFVMAKPVTINVKTTPAGADIVLDGVPVTTTKTPASFVRPAGVHTVSVSMDGFYGASGSFNIVPPRWSTYTFSFTLKPATNDVSPYGKIVVDSAPQDAMIYLDGAYTGANTPGYIETDPGKHPVFVTLEGYGRPDPQEATVVTHGETELMFTLKPAIMAKAVVVPRTLNLGRKGMFLAFVRLPEGYRAADVYAGSVFCNGAPAERLIRPKATPRLFAAIFSRAKLVAVEPGSDVVFTVSGDVKAGGKAVPFSASDTIRVISSNGKAKEDTDGAEKMTDTQVLQKFMPKNL
jgi:hypothetical protein